MKMKITIILWTLAACSAQHRRSRINDGRYYFGTNPPRPNNQRPKNSVAFAGSNNPPSTRVENTYNIENFNSIRRTSTVRITTSRPSTRKKLRVVIRRRGNKYSYQDKRYDQRYKLQNTGSYEKYRLVDFGDRNKNSLELEESSRIGLKKLDTDNTNNFGESKSSRQKVLQDSRRRYAEPHSTNRFEEDETYKLRPIIWKPDKDSIRSSSDDDRGTERKLTEGHSENGAISEKTVCSRQCLGSSGKVYGDKNSAILSRVQEIQTGGGYHFEYKTENRISGEERRTPVNNPDESEASRGYYQYTGPDNVVYRVDYQAGKEGFIPVAAHLPTPPPIPLAILRSLEYQKNYKN